MENEGFWNKVGRSVRAVLPTTAKTCWWILKLTVGVSFAMLLLRYFNILPWISKAVDPLFRYFGLPGDAALAYVSGYFVNVYSALAVMGTLDLDVRAITILGTMVLCSHSMILETAVMRKTGAPVARMVIIRTLGALTLGFVLNLLLPRSGETAAASSAVIEDPQFWPMLSEWFWKTLKLCLMMTVIIFTLNILQRILNDFGVIARMSGFMNPVMAFFGLPGKVSFLWLVANIVGLGYGAAAMLDEIGRGGIDSRDVKLFNTHVSVSHSNFEDLLLISAAGGIWWVLLLSRWALSFLLVWEYRLELYILSNRKK